MSPTLRAIAGAGLLGLVLITAGPPAAAQRRSRDVCPYCRNDAKLMEKAGVVNHGPFQFASKTTEDVQATLPFTRMRWIETAHIRLGTDLPGYTVPMNERKKIRSELEELARLLPGIKPKARLLDPWLRLHLFAWRAEKLYSRFQEILKVTDASFPGQRPHNYMGEGPYLGEKGKYEVILHHRETSNKLFLKEFTGVHQSHAKWHNYPEIDNLMISLSSTGGALTGKDSQTHNGMVHLLTHVFLNGYRHYSYDIPIWFHEGLAHWLTYENYEGYPFYCLGEGTTRTQLRSDRWRLAMRKLLVGEDDVPLPALMKHRSFGEFKEAEHLTVFSKIDYMLTGFDDDGQGFVDFVNHIKGRLKEDGFPDGSDQAGRFREAFTKAFGVGMLRFDANWREWVLKTYPTR